jgi:uncharacterized membrane protein (DUF2068 family)
MLSPETHIDGRLSRKIVLRAVASLELLKGVAGILLGVTATLLVHKDTWVIAESLLAIFHINTDQRWALMFLDFADNLTDGRLWAAAELAFVYSALRFAEGYGLWKQRIWAEWLAFASGMLLVPLEIRALLREVTLLRAAVFLLNIAVILYMFFLLREGRRMREQAEIDSLKPRPPSGSTGHDAGSK